MSRLPTGWADDPVMVAVKQGLDNGTLPRRQAVHALASIGWTPEQIEKAIQWATRKPRKVRAKQWHIVRQFAASRQYWCDKESRWLDSPEGATVYSPKPVVKWDSLGGACFASEVPHETL